MIIHHHFRNTFKCLKVENVTNYGWAVVGKKSHNSRNFAIVAGKCESEENAKAALKELKR